MKTRYRLTYRGCRGGMFYCVDNKTGKRTSLHTSDADEARQLVEIKNQAVRQPEMNLQIAQVYLQHGDPTLASRTWQHVMEQIISTKTGNTRDEERTEVIVVAERFLRLFVEHGVAVAQIQRYLPQISLDKLETLKTLLGALSNEVLEETTQLGGLVGSRIRAVGVSATCLCRIVNEG